MARSSRLGRVSGLFSRDVSRRTNHRSRPFRTARFEPLEIRQLLSAAPTLASLADVTLYAGAPLHIALDGYDADGDTLTFSATTTSSLLSTYIPTGNRSMRISVQSADGTIDGDMIFQLFEDRAPRTTARIIALAESDFYDGLLFHRVAEYSDGTPFVIQGGDPAGNGTGGSGVDFDDEFHPDLMHTSAGILSMAKSSDDTNDSQFFITGTATRHLDFNHSIFGFLTEGDDVRQAIQSVDVDANSKPLVNVVMSSVEIFYDVENGVLMLSAPEGTTGEADVTVTVDDGNGGTAQQTFHVTIVADTPNSAPYLQPIDDVETTAGVPVTFTLPGFDVEGDAMYYAGYVYPSSSDLTMTIDSNTGQVTITPTSTAAGVYGILVGVRSATSDWDVQAVPVLVTPGTPTSISLLTSSDTGASSTDGITNHDNSGVADDRVLGFRVYGVATGATVSVYADGQLIGQATAIESSVVVLSTGQLTLADGVHQITAIQTLADQPIAIGNRTDSVTLTSQTSAAYPITVDRTKPVISSSPVIEAAAGAVYSYNVESDAETAGEARYRLDYAPAGMLIDPQTGLITWTPQESQEGTQSVTVVVADLAGNETQQAFNVSVNQSPDIWTIGNKLVQEGETLSFTVTAVDPDGDTPLVYSLAAGAPEGAAIDPETGEFTWTPTEAQGPGEYDIYFKVTDSAGSVGTQKIRVTVTEENLVPLLAEIPDYQVDEGQLLSFLAAATDPDLPANVLTYTLRPGAPSGAAIDPATGRFTWRPGETHGGHTYSITVRVTDSAGAFDEKTFTVAVNEIDDQPVFAAMPAQFLAPGMDLRVRAEAVDPDIPTNSIRYELAAGAPAGAAIHPTTGVVTWSVPRNFPLGEVDLVVRAVEVRSDGTDGLATTGTLRVSVVTYAPDAFDAALARSTFDRVTMAPLANVALLDDAAPRIRFVPLEGAVPSRVRPRDEGPLGFQIASDTGGDDATLRDEQAKPKEESQSKPAKTESAAVELGPRTGTKRPHGETTTLRTLDLPIEEGSLSALLDAAMETLSDEELTADVVDVAKAPAGEAA